MVHCGHVSTQFILIFSCITVFVYRKHVNYNVNTVKVSNVNPQRNANSLYFCAFKQSGLPVKL